MMKITAFSLFFLLLTLLSVAVVAEEDAVRNGLRNHRGLNGRLKRRLSKGKGDDDDAGKGGKGKGDDDDAGKGGKGKGDDDDAGKGGKGKGDDDDAGKGGKGGKGKGDDDDAGKGKGVSRRHLQNIFA